MLPPKKIIMTIQYAHCSDISFIPFMVYKISKNLYIWLKSLLIKTISLRNKCSACFKQYNRKEHLVEHMRISYHSVHEPKCGICKKHCRYFESLREHLTGESQTTKGATPHLFSYISFFSHELTLIDSKGSLPKIECARIFFVQGCNLCLTILDSPYDLMVHRRMCQLSRIDHVSSCANPSVLDEAGLLRTFSNYLKSYSWSFLCKRRSIILWCILNICWIETFLKNSHLKNFKIHQNSSQKLHHGNSSNANIKRTFEILDFGLPQGRTSQFSTTLL